MFCKEIEEKLVDYIDRILDEKDYVAVESHIEHCTDCKNNLKELAEGIDYIEEINKNIKAPYNLMEVVKKEVDIKRTLTKKPRLKIANVALISILMTLLITGVFADEGIKSYFEIWKGKGLEESHSIEQLIEDGYGQKLNLIAKDKNIKVTVESIVADDINTVLLIEIEDLKGEKKYAPIIGEDGIIAKGKFNYSDGKSDIFKIDKAEIKGSFLLYTPEKNKTRTVIAFNPVASEHEEIELIINALEGISEKDTRLPNAIGGQYYYDKHFENIVEGSWSFKVPVQPSKSIVFDLNEEMDLDGHKIIFNQLIVSPTMTTLTYKFNKRQNKEYILNNLNNINIEADGKLYEMKSLGGSSTRSVNFGPSEGTISFDTMYFQIPKKIKIIVNGYGIAVKEQSALEIDVKKPFPQDFKYLGNEIRVTNVQGDENLIRVSIDNLGEKCFERLDYRILINNKEYIETQHATKFLFAENENKVYEIGYDILLNNTTKIFSDYPKEGYEVTSRSFDYLAYESDEKIVEELKLKDTLDDKIKSVIIKIEGYEEQRSAIGSISLKLNKYRQ